MNTKAASERYQRQVLEISKHAGNESCADCRGRYPRWASWNLGIFLCVNCAGVHRKMGTHISKIKSLTLDTWTKEQVEKMREGGNVKNNLKFNPDERRNRPPANVDEGERNSELERFIFDKYKGRFMDKKPPPVPMKDLPALRTPNENVDVHPSHRRVTEGLEGLAVREEMPRSRTAPIPSSWAEAKRAASVSPSPLIQQKKEPVPSLPVRESLPSSIINPPSNFPIRQSSAAIVISNGNAKVDTSLAPSATAAQQPTSSSSVFDDLLSISNGHSTIPQPPLQMQQTPYTSTHHLGNPWAALGTHQQAILSPMMMSNGASYFQQQQQQQTFYSDAGERSASLGNMAFPGTSPFASSHPTGGNPYFSNNGAQMMGQQAFGQPSPSFLSPQQTSFQPITMPQQQQQSPQFGTFANNMMPPSQQPLNPWQHNGNNHQNMWG